MRAIQLSACRASQVQLVSRRHIAICEESCKLQAVRYLGHSFATLCAVSTFKDMSSFEDKSEVVAHVARFALLLEKQQ